jgi:hypothetical protein
MVINLRITELIEHNKTTTYDVGCLGFEQEQMCGGVKPVNEIPTHPS